MICSVTQGKGILPASTPRRRRREASRSRVEWSGQILSPSSQRSRQTRGRSGLEVLDRKSIARPWNQGCPGSRSAVPVLGPAGLLRPRVRPAALHRGTPTPAGLLVLLVDRLGESAEARPWSRNLSLQTAFLALCALSVTYARNYFSAYIGTRTMFGNVVIALAVTWLMARRRDFDLGNLDLGSRHRLSSRACDPVRRIRDWRLSRRRERRRRGLLRRPALCASARNASFPDGDAGRAAPSRCCSRAAIVASSSRGGFVALVAVVVYGVLREPASTSQSGDHGCRGSACSGRSVPTSYKGKSRRSSRTSRTTQAESRTFLWKAAWNMWLDHPVVGVGVENFNWNVGLYQPRESSRPFQQRHVPRAGLDDDGRAFALLSRCSPKRDSWAASFLARSSSAISRRSAGSGSSSPDIQTPP